MERADKRTPAGIAGRLLCALVVTLAANCVYPLLRLGTAWPAVFLAAAFVLANLLPSRFARSMPGFRLRMCASGGELLAVFLGAAVVSLLWHTAAAVLLFPAAWQTWVISAVVAVCVLSVVFWNGILRVYCTSVQLGIRERVIGILCGWIPILQIWALLRIIRIVLREARFERARAQLDADRRAERICATRYPILLVHGVFFRDYKYLNYWGRIPGALEQNDARIFYGNHQSAASVADSAAELAARIREIVRETGCEKVNIIAHSKGGLDCRWALTHTDAAACVASVTTVNTPHRGCLFADYLLEKIPAGVQESIARKYNAAMRHLGDSSPDFLAAVRDLTASACVPRDAALPPPAGVYCQSVGSRLNRATGGKFPLNMSYPLVKHFDGANDGLVAESSFSWGGRYTYLTVPGRRGISHGDVIDLNRENIPGFDVREFYVQLVSALKMRGL